MVDFATHLGELEHSSKQLGFAADAAKTAHDKVDGMGITAPKPNSFPDASDVFGGIPESTNDFGSTLGLPRIAYAYEQHRQQIVELVDKLHANTEATSVAMMKVHDLYEENEADSRAQLQQINNALGEL